jgi:hypothetical protein
VIIHKSPQKSPDNAGLLSTRDIGRSYSRPGKYVVDDEDPVFIVVELPPCVSLQFLTVPEPTQ